MLAVTAALATFHGERCHSVLQGQPLFYFKTKKKHALYLNTGFLQTNGK